MNDNNFIKSYEQLFESIDLCIKNQLILPALVLLYSCIDSISWVACEDDKLRNVDRFQNWVNSWMFQNRPLPCTAEELYSARCGILHSLTPDSTLTEKKGVRIIYYAWGEASRKQLDSYLHNKKRYVALHINELYDSLLSGFFNFYNEIQEDEKRMSFLIEKEKKYFSNIEF